MSKKRKAAKLYNKGCDAYFDQNFEKAMKFFTEAAEMGDMDAMSNIAIMYENGDGVDLDINKAISWYRKAAEAGDEEAEERLLELDPNAFDEPAAEVSEAAEQAVEDNMFAAPQGSDFAGQTQELSAADINKAGFTVPEMPETGTPVVQVMAAPAEAVSEAEEFVEEPVIEKIDFDAVDFNIPSAGSVKDAVQEPTIYASKDKIYGGSEPVIEMSDVPLSDKPTIAVSAAELADMVITPEAMAGAKDETEAMLADYLPQSDADNAAVDEVAGTEAESLGREYAEKIFGGVEEIQLPEADIAETAASEAEAAEQTVEEFVNFTEPVTAAETVEDIFKAEKEEIIAPEIPETAEPFAAAEPVFAEPVIPEEPVFEETVVQEEPIFEETVISEEPVFAEPAAPVEPVVEEVAAASEPVVEEEPAIADESWRTNTIGPKLMSSFIAPASVMDHNSDISSDIPEEAPVTPEAEPVVSDVSADAPLFSEADAPAVSESIAPETAAEEAAKPAFAGPKMVTGGPKFVSSFAAPAGLAAIGAVAAGKAFDDVPSEEEPAAEEPVVEEIFAEEPAVEGFITEEPSAEEIVGEEPVVEETVVEEPAAEAEPDVQEETPEPVFADAEPVITDEEPAVATADLVAAQAAALAAQAAAAPIKTSKEFEQEETVVGTGTDAPEADVFEAAPEVQEEEVLSEAEVEIPEVVAAEEPEVEIPSVPVQQEPEVELPPVVEPTEPEAEVRKPAVGVFKPEKILDKPMVEMAVLNTEQPKKERRLPKMRATGKIAAPLNGAALMGYDKYKAYEEEAREESPFSEIKPKDLLTFGAYPQDKDGRLAPIKWQVLTRKGNLLLVISENILDAGKFDNEGGMIWSEASIRRWLNTSFYEYAFTPTERTHIAEATNKTPTGRDELGIFKDNEFTTEKVFLLGHEDIQYLEYPGSIDGELDPELARSKATDFAKKRGIVSKDWWMRVPGTISNTVTMIEPLSDKVNTASAKPEMKKGIRPAIWLDLTGAKR